MYNDPSGHCPWCVILAGAIIGGVSAGIQSDWDTGAIVSGAWFGAVGGLTGGAGYGAAYSGVYASTGSATAATIAAGAHSGFVAFGTQGFTGAWGRQANPGAGFIGTVVGGAIGLGPAGPAAAAAINGRDPGRAARDWAISAGIIASLNIAVQAYDIYTNPSGVDLRSGFVCCTDNDGNFIPQNSEIAEAQYENLKWWVPGFGGVLGIGSAAGRALLKATPSRSVISKTDLFHSAPTFMRETAARLGTHFKIYGGDGSPVSLTQIIGNLNGQAGRFEFIVDEAGNLTHQLFIRGGGINGKPIVP